MVSKVLIVDDDPKVRKTIREVLSPKYITVEAIDGEEALKLAIHESVK